MFVPPQLAIRRRAFVSRIACLFLLTALLSTSCGGPQTPAGTETTPDVRTISPTVGQSATETPTGEPCENGNLRIRDLPAIENQWQQGLEDAAGRAEAWQSDAFLTSFRIGCEVLGPGFRWQATFYSPSLQAYYASDTGETVTSEDDPARVAALPTDGLSFGLLGRSLTKAGYGESTELSASTGIEIRLNSPSGPFGPPDAPDDVVLYHVAVVYRGEIRDLFVNSTDGTVYRYTF